MDRAQLGDEEEREVTASGLDPSSYGAVRAAGATHHEVMEAHVLGVDLHTYAMFRALHTHRRALDEAAAPGSPTHDDARRLGVSASEMAEVRDSHRDATDAYWTALADRGQPPEDVPVTRIGDYLLARRNGLDHTEALDYAKRLATLSPRPDPRDVMLWARCRAAGLPLDLTFVAAPGGRGRSLDSGEVEVLAALLLAVRRYAEPPVEFSELVWLASRRDAGRLDLEAYLEARRQDRPRWAARRAAARLRRPG